MPVVSREGRGLSFSSRLAALCLVSVMALALHSKGQGIPGNDGSVSIHTATKEVTVAVFSPDGKRVYVAGLHGSLEAFDAQTGKRIRTFVGHKRDVWALAATPDGKTLAAGDGANLIKLWNVDNGDEVETIRGHDSDVMALAFSGNGKELLSGSSDNSARLCVLQSLNYKHNRPM